LQAAGRIVEGDENSWHREWKRLAEAAVRRGEEAAATGNQVTAASNWLRAINYYLASFHGLEATDRRCHAAIKAMRKCAESYLHCAPVGGEIVSIPWLKDRPLQGYLLQPPGRRRPSPAVVCIGEPGRRKEEYLFKLARHARDRNLTLLALDLWGDHDSLEGVLGYPAIETVLPRVLDYLSGRDDIDVLRTAVLADGWGSSFVARGVAAEPRVSAAVCDGGLWDLHERCYLAGRSIGSEVDAAPDPFTSRIARNIECPLLITLGEQGWLKAGRVSEIVDELKDKGRDVTFRLFTAAETAAAQGHADNPTLANEFIFDWLSSRLMPAA
jgi:dienelactone hydrolase